MVSVSPIQNAFNGGEVSPRLRGRTDLAKYASSAATVENFLIQPEGGLMRRSGSRYVAGVEDNNVKSRLVPFIFSREQAYVLEFGDKVIRFYKNEAQIEASADTPLALADGVGGADVPYLEADLFELQFAQSADILYITHKSYAPRKLSRAAADDTAWTLTVLDYIDGPYGPENFDDTYKIAVEDAGGSVSTVGDAITLTSTGFSWVAADVSRVVRVYTSAAPGAGERNWGCAKITARTSASEAAAVVQKAWPAEISTPAVNFRLGLWYGGNYPTTVTFYEQRLCFGGEPVTPQALHGSASGDFEVFSPDSGLTAVPELVASDAINFTINSNEVNPIQWMMPVRVLLVGTTGGMWPVSASSSTAPITATDVNIRRANAFGSSTIAPVTIDDAIIHLSRSNRKVRSVGFDLDRDNYLSEDLTILADHVLLGGASELVYQSEPNSIMWAVRNDGQLAGCTLLLEQQVFGWQRVVAGGSFGSGDAVIESAAVIPAPSGDHDQLWVTVKRTVNENTVRYVEFFEEEFPDDGAQEDAFFVDSGLTITPTGTPTVTCSGLSHLEGETVQILADGAPVPSQVVASGVVTLTEAATKVQIGLGYTSTLATLPLNFDVPGGTSQGKTKRISDVVLRFYRTVGGEVSSDGVEWDDLIFATAGDLMDTPTPLFTGDYETLFDDSWGTEGQVYVRVMQPVPMNLLALIMRVSGSTR